LGPSSHPYKERTMTPSPSELSLMIDLNAVRYMDASSFSALIGAQENMTARPDKLYIVAGNPLLQRLFSIPGLETFFDLYVTADDALAAAV